MNATVAGLWVPFKVAHHQSSMEQLRGLRVFSSGTCRAEFSSESSAPFWLDNLPGKNPPLQWNREIVFENSTGQLSLGDSLLQFFFSEK